MHEFFINCMRIFYPDQGKNLKEALEHEPLEPCNAMFEPMMNAHPWTVKLFSYLASRGDPRMKGLIHPELDGHQIIEVHVKAHEIKTEIYKEINEKQIDAIIMPTVANPAPIRSPTAGTDCAFSLYLTLLANYCNMPAGTLNWTTVREYEQFYETKHACKETLRIQESAKGSKGLPVGVQVVSTPLREEIVLNVMKQLEQGRKDQYVLPVNR